LKYIPLNQRIHFFQNSRLLIFKLKVTFNMDTRRPFGMSVVVKRNRYFYGIVVHEVSPS